MAQSVETTIKINGVKIKQFTSLKLMQSIYEHHRFTLVCLAKDVEADEAGVFNGSKSLIGEAVHINVISEPEYAQMQFTGVVTGIETCGDAGQPEIMVIYGHSPTYLLDSGLHCRSWMRNSVGSIVKDVLRMYQNDTIKYKIDPDYKKTLYYSVQYNETAWQFICRLAARYGEWLFYDGNKLVLGFPAGKKFTLDYGVQMSRYATQMKIKRGKFQATAFDYVGNKVYSSEVAHTELNAGHNGMSGYALAKGEELMSAQTTNWRSHFVRSQKQVEDALRIRAASEISDVVQLKGCSDMPGFQPGDCVTIYMDKTKGTEGEKPGEFNIISVEHNWDGMGNYLNEFTAIPATVKTPPVKNIAEPYCEMQSAVVVNNKDDSELGRVQVRFHWMSKEEKSPWLRVVSPYSGKNKGVYIRPEIGEEVMVVFSYGNPMQPHVIGTMYNGGAKSAFGKTDNDIKAIYTCSGIKLVMNDSNGSLLMEDKAGNSVRMDGKNAIVVEAKETLKLKCGEALLVMKDGEITFEGVKLHFKATQELNMESGKIAMIDAAIQLLIKAGLIKIN